MIVKTNYLEILKSVANYMLDNIGNPSFTVERLKKAYFLLKIFELR